jgi:hypothetical protein
MIPVDQINTYVIGLMSHGYNDPISLMSKGLIHSFEYETDEDLGGGAGWVGGNVKMRPLEYDDAKKEIEKKLKEVDGKIRKLVINVDAAKIQKKNVAITVSQIQLEIKAQLIKRHPDIKIEVKLINI